MDGPFRAAPVVAALAVLIALDGPVIIPRQPPGAGPAFQEADRARVAAVHFTTVTDSGIPSDQYLKSLGGSWGDYDADGWVDLFLSNHFLESPFLYHNNGDGTFTDRAGEAGMNVHTDRHGTEWGDFDGDGDLDLYVTAGGSGGSGGIPSPAQLWRNNRDGTFTDVAEAMGVQTTDDERGRTVNWFDYDGDGDLDMFVTNYSSEPQHPPSRLFRNDGTVFTDVAADAGLAEQLTVGCGSLADYDRDTDIDLLLSHDPRGTDALVLYNNQGDGTFSRIPPSTSRLLGRILQGAVWFDFDNDGDVDLFATSHYAGFSKFFLNNGNGTFTNVTAATGLAGADAEPIIHAVAFDADNDSYQDLFIVRGAIGPMDPDPNPPDLMFHNNGDGTFSDVTAGAGVEGSDVGAGTVAQVADYNQDGFLDLVVGNGDAPFAGPYTVFRNDGNMNHWFRVELQGTAPNTHAFGSKVWIQAGGVQQYREYFDFGVCSAQNEQVAHFGLGALTTVDRLMVRWPSGVIQMRAHLAADQHLVLVEP